MMIFKGIIYEMLFVLCEIEIFPQVRVKFLNCLRVSTNMGGKDKSNDLFSFLLFSVGKGFGAGFGVLECLDHDDL